MRLAPLHWFAAILLTACAGTRSPVPQQSLPAARPTPQATSSQRLPLPLPPIVGIPHYVPQLGHSGEITSLAWNHDGRLIATASKEEGVKLWAMPQGAVVAELHTQATDPSDLAFGPDGHSLAVANWSGALEFWDLDELRPRATHRDHQGSVQSVAYSPDGGLLLSGGEDGTIYVYETRAQKLRGRITGMPAAVYAMAFSPDGKRLACSAGSKVQIRESGTWRPLHALEAHVKPVTSMAWSADSSVLATAGEDGQISTWNAATGAVMRTMEAGASVQDLSWSTPTNLIAAGLGDGIVQLWNPHTGERDREWGRMSSPIVAFHPTRPRLALSDAGSALITTDDLSLHSSTRLGEPMPPAFSSWDPGHDRMLILTEKAGLTQIEIDGLRTSVADWWSGDTLSWDLAGSWVAVLSKSGRSRIIDARNGKTIGSSPDELTELGVSRVSVAPDGKTVAQPGPGGALHLWQVGNSKHRKLEHGPEYADAHAWSPDGSRLALPVPSRGIGLWSVSTGKQAALLPTEAHVLAIAYRPDGKQVAASEEESGRIRIWGVATREETAALEGPAHALALEYSPDSRWLAAAGPKSGVRVWDAQTGKLQRSIESGSGSLSWHSGSRVLSMGGTPVGLVRVEDGALLWAEVGGDPAQPFVFGVDGLHEGAASQSTRARFRIGKGAVESAMIPPSQLPDTYRHAGLLRDFIEGRPIPHPQAGVAAQPH